MWHDNVRMKSYAHQVVGVELLTEHACFGLFDEMGACKTKQVIDAAQILFEKHVIDKVVVVAPASVRSVWYDSEFGELAKHLWKSNTSRVIEYHQKKRSWDWNPHPHKISIDTTFENIAKEATLFWLITNYDFIRREHRMKPLLDICTDKTLLVLDESSAVKNHSALQTKACLKLRKRCGRVVLLNGTPIANSPGDMYSQGNILDPAILDCSSYYHFRARYAILGGFRQKQVVGWRGLEDIQRRFKPHVIRRLKEECLDLPRKMPPVILTVPLTQGTWKRYKEMRDEMIAWLDEQRVSMAPQAIVKALRLSQLTSGFLGGIQDHSHDIFGDEAPLNIPKTEEISREKLYLFLSWLDNRLIEESNLKLLVWCRFRPELKRMVHYLSTVEKYEKILVGGIHGGQKADDRQRALRLLDPQSAPKDKPVVVIGSPQAGGLGLNLAAAHDVIYVSNDFSLKNRLQSMDRVHRPGQTYPVSYFDLVATGPEGQKTMDHVALKAIRAKESLANWTTSAWIQALKGDEENGLDGEI